MAESWVRLWAGMTTDPKFRTVARKSGSSVAEVVVMFAHLILIANESQPRGDLDGFNVEDVASALDMDEERVQSIQDAMEGRLIDGSRIIDWAKFQAPAQNHRQSAEVWLVTRARVFERDDFTCRYCGRRGVHLECDHIVPVSQGGSNEDENLATACRDCNRAKGARTPEQWRGR